MDNLGGRFAALDRARIDSTEPVTGVVVRQENKLPDIPDAKDLGIAHEVKPPQLSLQKIGGLESNSRAIYREGWQELTGKQLEEAVTKQCPGYKLGKVVSFGHLGGKIGRWLGIGGQGAQAFLLEPTDQAKPSMIWYHGTNNLPTALMDIDPRGIGRSLLNWRGNGLNSEIATWMSSQKNGIITTGHSLGGALANMTAIYAPEGVAVHAYSFAAPGVNKDAHKAWEAKKNSGSPVKVTSFEGDGDPVAQWGWRKVGDVHQVVGVSDHNSDLIPGFINQTYAVNRDAIETETSKRLSKTAESKNLSRFLENKFSYYKYGELKTRDGLDKSEEEEADNNLQNVLEKANVSKENLTEDFETQISLNSTYKQLERAKTAAEIRIRSEVTKEILNPKLESLLTKSQTQAQKYATQWSEERASPTSSKFWTTALHRAAATVFGPIIVAGVAIKRFLVGEPFEEKCDNEVMRYGIFGAIPRFIYLKIRKT